MKPFSRGEYVVAPPGTVGVVHEVTNRRVTVQFGSDGPFIGYNPESLRWATKTEVDNFLGNPPRKPYTSRTQGSPKPPSSRA